LSSPSSSSSDIRSGGDDAAIKGFF
jgi:hypothetical protein